ncbi:MAG TPA: GAF domain-containing protein, partial [Rhizomicrobium sp.]|nr:GAF domain-containing protein [Rhizomicrobium sp.]
MQTVRAQGPCPPEIFITRELDRRPPRRTDYLAEKRAIQDLAARLIEHPEEVLPRFVELAMLLTGGISAGLSLLEPDPAPGVFRWRYLRGRLAPFENATTPRDFSPCGVTLDQNRPVLSKHPERFYDWISGAGIEAPEVLLVPLYIGGTEPLGTLWILADTADHFDSGDARTASELASFLGIGL